MSELYEETKEQFEAVRDEVKRALADGKIRVTEITGIVKVFVEGAILIANELSVPSDEKRAVVVEAMMAWWNDPEDGLKKLDLPGPDAILDPAIESILPGLTGLAIDGLVLLYNCVGWPKA